MSGLLVPEALQERESDLGQLRLALEDLETGFGAEPDQPGIAGQPSDAELPAASTQVLDLSGPEAEHALRVDDFEHPVTAYLNSLAHQLLERRHS